MAKRAGQNGLDVVYLRRETEESSDLTPSLEALQSLGRQTLALGLSSQKAHVNRGKLCDHLCTLAETVCMQQVHRRPGKSAGRQKPGRRGCIGWLSSRNPWASLSDAVPRAWLTCSDSLHSLSWTLTEGSCQLASEIEESLRSDLTRWSKVKKKKKRKRISVPLRMSAQEGWRSSWKWNSEDEYWVWVREVPDRPVVPDRCCEYRRGSCL